MKTAKNLLISFLILLVIGAFFPIQETVQATSGCRGIAPLTDPQAIKMENGQRLIWDDVTPKLLLAKAKYERLLREKGWKITYDSAYRPLQYQQHFYQIIHAPSSTCRSQEIKTHGLTGVVAKPDPNAPHVKGIAFDATVYDKDGHALNGKLFVSPSLIAVAKQAGLKFTFTKSDGVHHEWFSKHPTAAAPTSVKETPYRKTAKVATRAGLRVRKSASSTAARIGSVPYGRTVTITGKAGNFYKIKYGKGYGYIPTGNGYLK
jgi:hypothetical protein